MPSTGQEESNAVLNYKIATMQRSKNWGLQGGERGNKARHEEVSKYYTRVHEPIEKKK